MKSAVKKLKFLSEALSKASPKRKSGAPEIGDIAAAALTAVAAVGGLIVSIKRK